MDTCKAPFFGEHHQLFPIAATVNVTHNTPWKEARGMQDFEGSGWRLIFLLIFLYPTGPRTSVSLRLGDNSGLESIAFASVSTDARDYCPLSGIVSKERIRRKGFCYTERNCGRKASNNCVIN